MLISLGAGYSAGYVGTVGVRLYDHSTKQNILKDMLRTLGASLKNIVETKSQTSERSDVAESSEIRDNDRE